MVVYHFTGMADPSVYTPSPLDYRRIAFLSKLPLDDNNTIHIGASTPLCVEVPFVAPFPFREISLFPFFFLPLGSASAWIFALLIVLITQQ